MSSDSQDATPVPLVERDGVVTLSALITRLSAVRDVVGDLPVLVRDEDGVYVNPRLDPIVGRNIHGVLPTENPDRHALTREWDAFEDIVAGSIGRAFVIE